MAIAESREANPPRTRFAWDNFRIEWVNARAITVDSRYQRALLDYKVRRIAGNFDAEAVGVLLLSEREDGTLVILDGQHRLAALKMVNHPRVLCQVYTGLSLAREAQIYIACNHAHATPKSTQVFRARLWAGDATALAISEIARETGMELGLAPPYSPAALKAVRALERIYRESGADMLREVLELLHQAWPDDPLARRSDIILGLHLFLSHEREQPAFDAARLRDKLASLPMPALLREARSYAEVMGGQTRRHIARIVLRVYNEHLSTRRLPDYFAVHPRQEVPAEDDAAREPA